MKSSYRYFNTTSHFCLPYDNYYLKSTLLTQYIGDGVILEINTPKYLTRFLNVASNEAYISTNKVSISYDILDKDDDSSAFPCPLNID